MTPRARSGIGAWLCLSATLCLAVIVSSRSDPSELGAPVYWTWALTGLQAMALWFAGRGQAWGWMVGSAVQPGWIAYALMTDQLGFVIGCGISAGVQLSAYLRANGAIDRAGAGPTIQIVNGAQTGDHSTWVPSEHGRPHPARHRLVRVAPRAARLAR